MPSEAEFAERIQQFDWPDLDLLWQQITAGDTPEWPAGKAFEYLVLRAFQHAGAEVRWPFSVRINSEVVEQIDGVVYYDGLTCMVESKDTSSPKNIEVVAKLRNQLLRRHGATIGLVFSRSGYTGPALTLAQFTAPQTILLWNGGEIGHALARRSFPAALRTKYRRHIEQGIADYDIRGEEIA